MPTITPTNKTSLGTILQNEGNPNIKSKLEQYVSYHGTTGGYLPNVSRLVDLAQFSTQKTALLAWISSLT